MDQFSNLNSHTLEIYLKRGPDCWFLFFCGLNFRRKMVQVFFCCLPERINFFNFTITKHECFKYVKSNKELPCTQEDQLRFLFNQFSFSDLKTAFTIAITTDDKNAIKVYYPIPNTKKKLMTCFLGLVFDRRSIMADVSKNTYRWVMIMSILFNKKYIHNLNNLLITMIISLAVSKQII